MIGSTSMEKPFLTGDFLTVSAPKEYIHRVLGGGNLMQSVFYPSVGFDNDNMEKKTVWKVIKKGVDIDYPSLKFLEALDKSLRKPHVEDDKKIRSQFTPSRRWLYFVFDKQDGEVKIQIAQYPWKVADEIDKLQEKESITEKGYLRYGPTFTWDAIITHEYDKYKKVPEYAKHSYKVEPDPRAKFAGLIPVDILDANKFPDPMEALKDILPEIFSKEELQAIEDYSVNLNDIAKPHTEEEVLDMFAEFPIDFNAKRSTATGDIPIFPTPELYIEKTNEAFGKIALPASESTSTKAKIPESITEEPKQEKVKILTKKEETEEQEAVEVPAVEVKKSATPKEEQKDEKVAVKKTTSKEDILKDIKESAEKRKASSGEKIVLGK